MDFKKSLLVVAVILCLVVGLVGCGDNQETTNFSMGSWDENVYTNEFLNVKLTLPEGWEYSSDEEIANMMSVSTEAAFGDKEFLAEVAKLTSVYYVVATDPNTGNNLSIISEKPLVDVTLDYYMENLKTQLSAVDSIRYEMGETAKTTLGTVEYDTLVVTAPDYGMTQKYYVHKEGKYFVGIIITAKSADEVLEIEKSFQ